MLKPLSIYEYVRRGKGCFNMELELSITIKAKYIQKKHEESLYLLAFIDVFDSLIGAYEAFV